MMKIINKRNPARTFLFGFFTPLLTNRKFPSRYIYTVTPDYEYKRISAFVTLDRSPIGKHKKTSSSKGVIVLYITDTALFEFGVEGDSTDTLYNSQLKEAFSSHMKPDVLYRMSIMVDRCGRNITILRYIIVRKEHMTQRYSTSIGTIRSEIFEYLIGEKDKHRDRLYPSNGTIRIIFIPDSNIWEDREMLLRRPFRGHFNPLTKTRKYPRFVPKANYSTSSRNSESQQNKMFDFSEFKKPSRNKYY